MYLLMQQNALKWGGRRESASTSSKVFQTAWEGDSDDKRSVYTLIYNIVSRLRQWYDVGESGGGEGGREAEVVGSKLGLSQIPPAAPLQNFSYLVNKKFVNFFLPHYKISLSIFTTLCRLFLKFLLLHYKLFLTCPTTCYRLFLNFS
jgi:hypothetical protein